MENTGTARVGLPWRFALLVPMALALALVVIARRQTNLHDEIRLTTAANLLVAVGIALQGVYWLVARKSPAVGISFVVIGSALFGFGMNTLLRVLGL